MLIYGALLSPFVRKVALIAQEKGVSYEVRMMRGPDGLLPEFLEASPFSKIPAIRDGDFTLADSSAIALYLETKHPSPSLLPADAQTRGRAIWFDEYADTIISAAGLKVLFNRFVAPKFLNMPGDEAAAEQGLAELPRPYAYLESVAPASGWLAGEDFTLADISVASMLRSLEYVDAQPKAADYPAAVAWYERVKARPAWAAVAREEEAAFQPA